MDPCKYRKIVCNAGHESRAFAEGEVLPRRCPVCNQPYDRRFNRPVLCYEDGSVPEESKPDLTIAVQENTSDSILPDQMAVIDTASEHVSLDLNMPRRGRRGVVERESSPASFGRRAAGLNRPVSEDAVPQDNLAGGDREHRPDVFSKIGLFNGGDCIQLSEEGCYLGREGYASHYLGINPQISRKHAYISVDRLGNILIKDAGSLNGTYVDNGSGRRRIRPGETVELKVGDSIWLANHILILGIIQ